MNSFFLKRKNNEDRLYSQIRDFSERDEYKKQIEFFWRIYKPYVQGNKTTFLSKAQKSSYFKQCWWEMVLTIGLLNTLDPRREIYKKRKEKGPDIIIKNSVNTSSKIYIEAIAPKEGETEHKLPNLQWGWQKVPEEEFLLRLSGAFKEKYKKYNSYLDKNLIGENDIYIIAISSCNLSEYGSLMDHPCPAPLKVLFGVGHQVVSPKKSFVKYRPQIMKGNSPVEVNYFLKNEYNGISAVIYSNAGILSCPNNPEETFIVIKNPFAKNPLPDKFLKDVTMWTFDKESNTLNKKSMI